MTPGPHQDLVEVVSLALERTGLSPKGTLLSNLLAEGRPTGIRVPGLVLEAQYRFGEEYLLFTTDDAPFEEALHIILLSPVYSAVDRLELGHPFAAGILRDLRPTASDTLQFSFFGGDLWALTLAVSPRWLRPREAPIGVKGRLRRVLARRRLVLVRLR